MPKVDLERYSGVWYEAARAPTPFQKQCVSDVRVEYTLRNDGKIQMVNTCKETDGKVDTARGTAKLASKDGSNARLKVTFFWPFYGDYWIIDLDPEYQWAIVGEPDRKYVWILTRAKQVDDATVNRLIESAAAKGYDPAQIVRTRQTEGIQ